MRRSAGSEAEYVCGIARVNTAYINDRYSRAFSRGSGNSYSGSFLTQCILSTLALVMHFKKPIARYTTSDSEQQSVSVTVFAQHFFGNSCATKGMVNSFRSTLELI